MPVLKRELAFVADRPMENAGEWWHLVLDAGTPGLYLEHTWKRATPHSDTEPTHEIQRFEINDFLMLAEGRPAQPVLLSTLGGMFRDAEPAFENPSS